MHCRDNQASPQQPARSNHEGLCSKLSSILCCHYKIKIRNWTSTKRFTLMFTHNEWTQVTDSTCNHGEQDKHHLYHANLVVWKHTGARMGLSGHSCSKYGMAEAIWKSTINQLLSGVLNVEDVIIENTDLQLGTENRPIRCLAYTNTCACLYSLSIMTGDLLLLSVAALCEDMVSTATKSSCNTCN